MARNGLCTEWSWIQLKGSDEKIVIPKNIWMIASDKNLEDLVGLDDEVGSIRLTVKR